MNIYSTRRNGDYATCVPECSLTLSSTPLLLSVPFNIVPHTLAKVTLQTNKLKCKCDKEKLRLSYMDAKVCFDPFYVDSEESDSSLRICVAMQYGDISVEASSGEFG